MAAAALISPSSPYPHQHHPSSYPFPSGYQSASNPSSVTNMISPTDSRRTSDDPELHSAQRHSLPSINDVIGSKSSGPSAPHQQPTSAPPAHNLPSPFSSTSTRPFPSDFGGERDSSPRILQPLSSTFPRSDSLPAFADPVATAPVGQRSAAPTNYSYPGVPSQPSPPFGMEHQRSLPPQRHEQDLRYPESSYHSNGSHQLPQHHMHTPSLSNQLPPGQMPLPNYPSPGRHSQSSLPSPFEGPRPGRYYDQPSVKYDHNISRHFEAWSYSEYLNKIASVSRTLYNFADSYGNLAREEHTIQPIPGRLPSDRECSEMLNLVEHMHQLCENVRNVVLQSQSHERSGRDGQRPKHIYEDEDVSMYDPMKSAYNHMDVKKRRGRAAPPGRCHSCNRIDTPEWRRGPDGARTLCNACGLHYAKLERKRQTEGKLRKPMDN